MVPLDINLRLSAKKLLIILSEPNNQSRCKRADTRHLKELSGALAVSFHRVFESFPQRGAL